MTEWEPATEAEAAMRDALRMSDQELYFQILARTELLLPVSVDALAGRTTMGWGTWSSGGRTHVLSFTSLDAIQLCLADNASSARKILFGDLARTWPNHEWWLAVNPGLPIEGYLPSWFVSQLARGDARLPGRTRRTAATPPSRPLIEPRSSGGAIAEGITSGGAMDSRLAVAADQRRSGPSDHPSDGRLPGWRLSDQRIADQRIADQHTIGVGPDGRLVGSGALGVDPASDPLNDLYPSARRSTTPPSDPLAASIARHTGSASVPTARSTPPGNSSGFDPAPSRSPGSAAGSAAGARAATASQSVGVRAAAARAAAWSAAAAEQAAPIDPDDVLDADGARGSGTVVATNAAPGSRAGARRRRFESIIDATVIDAEIIESTRIGAWAMDAMIIDATVVESDRVIDIDIIDATVVDDRASRTDIAGVAAAFGVRRRGTEDPRRSDTGMTGAPTADSAADGAQPFVGAPNGVAASRPTVVSAAADPAASHGVTPDHRAPVGGIANAGLGADAAGGVGAATDASYAASPAHADPAHGTPHATDGVEHGEPVGAQAAGMSDTSQTVPFEPANEVEENLLAAATSGKTDNFLSTLLLAKVLIPIPTGESPDVRPDDPSFPWRREVVDGQAYLVVFTSPERMTEFMGDGVVAVTARFVQLIRFWPDELWAFAVNPGSPVGATLPGAQIKALATWAADVGLTADDLPDDVSDAQEPEAPAAPTTIIMQKPIAPSQVNYYLERGYDRASGFVHRATEVIHLNTPEKIYAALGLSYSGSPFSRDATDIYALRWAAHRADLYRIPYGGQHEAGMRAMQGWMIERPPFRGNGFAPAEGGEVIAEFKVDSVRLPHGAQMWRLTSRGDRMLVAVLDADECLWRPAIGVAAEWDPTLAPKPLAPKPEPPAIPAARSLPRKPLDPTEDPLDPRWRGRPKRGNAGSTASASGVSER